MEYESVSGGRGKYPHKVDIKSLLTYNHLGKAGRQAGKQSRVLTGLGNQRCHCRKEATPAWPVIVTVT